MDESRSSFGYWLRRRRKALDLTQAALAQRVSCSQAAIKKIEAEERRPSLNLAQRLAQHLGIAEPDRAAFLQAARTLSPRARLPVDAVPVVRTALAAEGADPGTALRPPRNAQAGLVWNAPPLVGRDAELASIVGMVNRLASGSGQFLLIHGEAGIGKSRLLQEVATHGRQHSVPVLATNCYEIERSIAFQPVIDLATQACALASEARLRLIAPILLAEIAALVPAVGNRLPNLPPLSADLPEARQTRLFHALIELFDAVAHGRPLLVFADNVQWADDASLRFMHFYARQVAHRPVLLGCAYRDEEVEGNDHLAALVESLGGEAHTHRMPLARLGPAQTEALLQSMNDPRLRSPLLAQRLHRETGGNPFFLSSMMHALCEGDGVVGEASSLPLPHVLRDSVRARLARVPPADRGLLDVAAVLGRRFAFETLLALTAMPEESFLQALDTLVKRRLLCEEPDGDGYDFSHDKVREVVYGDISIARRVLLHRLIAEWLEQHGTGPSHERHAYLAEHYERGKVWSRALHHLGLAAELSQQLFAMREALQWFDRAVALADAHPDAATEGQHLGLLERRGAARALAGHTEGVVADFQRVIEVARGRGEHAHARDVLIQLGMAHRRADAYNEAIACLDEALSISRAIDDERHVADTLYHLGTVAWSNGRNDLAIGYHQKAVEICERLQLADLVAVQAFHGRGEAYFAQAEPAAAIASFSRSLELACSIGDKSYESENLMMIGWACTGHMGLADYSRGLASFDAALAIARKADLQWHLGPALIGRAYLMLSLGRCGDAWSDLCEALPRLQALRLVRYQLMAHDAMGCVLLALDRPREAAPHFDIGLGLARDAGIEYWVPRLHANLAVARLRRGQPVDRTALETAHRYANRHCELWLVSRCIEARAELALANGDAAGCAVHARELSSLASQGGMLELAGHAQRLAGLAAIGTAPSEAALALREALAQGERLGCLPLVRACHETLAGLYGSQGDADRAGEQRALAGALADRFADSLHGTELARDPVPSAD